MALTAWMDIDVSLCTVYTKLMERVEFSRAIAYFTSVKNETAKQVREYTDGHDKQSFWMDGSCLDTKRTGANVA